MVKVPSSRGGTVQVEIKGIAETIDNLRKKGIEIKNGTDVGLLQASNFVQQEVQESIVGNRAEPKSVDTGRFANSIAVDKTQDKEFKVYSRPSNYPGTVTTTQDVATLLEYGSVDIAPRMHFRNTAFRSKEKVKEIVKNAIVVFT